MGRPVIGVAPEIPGYSWVRALGAGGFADVHLYRQASPARDVAVKVLRVAGDGAGAEALAREADALTAVAGHPAVVTVHASGTTTDGRPYLAMEYCPVTDLPEQVRSQPMAVPRALEVMVQLCAAAETLHRAGLVHRDIKPANVMLSRWGQPVLADFGSVLPLGAAAPDGGGFSLLWAPPEQHLAGTPAHPSQDVWALAATAWTLLTGRSPFELPGEDNSAAAVAGRVRAARLSALGRPDAPTELVVTLREGLAADPSARPRSALELAQHLQAVQARLGRPRTPALVQVAAPTAAVRVDDNRTRVRAVPRVEPVEPGEPIDRPRRAQPGTVGLEVTGGPDLETTLPPGSSVPGPPAVASSGVRTGLPGWVLALAVLVAVLITAGGVSAALLGTGGGTRPAGTGPVQPKDPVAAPPSPVSGLTGTLTKGRVYWTWKPAGETGVRYLFTITRPGTDDLTKETTLTGTDAAAVAGENCIEISVVSQAGRESAVQTSCVTVP